MKDDLISRISLKQSIAASAILKDKKTLEQIIDEEPFIDAVPVIRCKDCKHNPKETWFECPMAALSEKQRPETSWCWKAERKKE